jgi:hypothetical protein
MSLLLFSVDLYPIIANYFWLAALRDSEERSVDCKTISVMFISAQMGIA